MLKATLTLANGTVVNIEGASEEVQNLLKLYSSPISDKIPKKKLPKESNDVKDYINTIVNLIKDCEENDNIEKNIIDRTSQVNKVLLPLYVIHEYLENKINLQTGEISKITKE
jgi:hypothetical protein